MISLSDLKRRIDQGELSPEAALSQSLEAIAAQERRVLQAIGRLIAAH